MTIATPGRAALGAAATMILLTACGGPAENEFITQSPRAITRTAFAEMAELPSVRMLGTVDADGRRVRIDVTADGKGSCVGSFQLANGGTRFIHDAETTWLKPDQDYWKGIASTPQQARQIMAEVGSSWTLAPAGTVDVASLCDPTSRLDGFEARKDGGDGRLSKGGVELVGETQAIEINEKGGGQSSTLWVSVETPHRVVKIVRREKGVAETISLEEFGVTVNAEAPAADDVVDLSSYEEMAPAK